MSGLEEDVRFTVLHRGKPVKLKALASSTLGDLGKEIVDLTGVAAHTLLLMIPKRSPLRPMSEQHSAMLLYEAGITEGLTMRMMGSSLEEVAAVSQPVTRDRIIGFSEEEERARRRASYAPGTYIPPKGNYIFCDFQTLVLPGIELRPPPALALKIMHKLASDRGIVAIMNKHRWRVGIMTEMAPEGYVGISSVCILGFNKNRGQEISLRLRTDDLKGFRKYESIKKTLLHELAHMVHDEHDEKFHSLDKQLNEEADALDWTKSHGHTLSGVKTDDEEESVDAGVVGSARGYKLGGKLEQGRATDPRIAAATAALRRLGDKVNSAPKSACQEQLIRMTMANSSMLGEKSVGADEVRLGSQEPDPDETITSHPGKGEPDSDDAVDTVPDFRLRGREWRPEGSWSVNASKAEPDPDDGVDALLDVPVRTEEPDPDEVSSEQTSKDEPDPDDSVDAMVGDLLLRAQKSDPGETLGTQTRSGSHDVVFSVVDLPVKSEEPDPDELVLSSDVASGEQISKDEPDPDDSVDVVADDLQLRAQQADPGKMLGRQTRPGVHDVMFSVLDLQVKSEEPDPDELVPPSRDEPDAGAHGRKFEGEPDPDEVGGKCSRENGIDECVGSCRMAAKRMKSSIETSGLAKFVTP